LAYLAAGVGFCFMTQLGRFAHIARQPLRSYRIVQENLFREKRGAQNAGCSPFDTHVLVDADLTEDDGRTLVRVSEQTCFLHAAMRGQFPSVLTLIINGKPGATIVSEAGEDGMIATQSADR
jgi:uncharacterized OsmC-like protein